MIKIMELKDGQTNIQLSGSETEWINKILVSAEHCPEDVTIEKLKNGGILATVPSEWIEFASPEDLEERGIL